MSYPYYLFRKRTWFYSFWLVGVLPLTLLGCNQNNEGSSYSQESAKTIESNFVQEQKSDDSVKKLFRGDTIQANDLLEYYVDHVVKNKEKEADAQLKNKKFHVEGYFDSSDIGSLTPEKGYVVHLYTDHSGQWIHCYFSEQAYKDYIGKLYNNTQIILYGKCSGFFSSIVQMEDCRMVKIKKRKTF